MKINADLTRQVVIYTPNLQWVDSPLPGVQRQMLERNGDEVARATSIVRYAPGSFFDAHIHDKGEEYFVLDGIFSDETGDYHTGMYVRNPPGSWHQPFSKQGCTILVKLRQFVTGDMSYVRVDTNHEEWLPGQVKGLHVKPLHEFGTEQVALMKWDPGTRYKNQKNIRGEEIYVISGSLNDENNSWQAGTWIRNPAGRNHELYSEQGCVIYVKTGHL